MHILKGGKMVEHIAVMENS